RGRTWGGATSVPVKHRASHSERHRLGLSGENLMVGVHQINPHVVRTGRYPSPVNLLLSLASAHHQGRSSTWMCKCPTRGDALRAPFPNTGKMRTFSTRHWIQTTPLASRSGSGGSTISLGAGSSLISAYGVAPRTAFAPSA